MKKRIVSRILTAVFSSAMIAANMGMSISVMAADDDDAGFVDMLEEKFEDENEMEEDDTEEASGTLDAEWEEEEIALVKDAGIPEGIEPAEPIRNSTYLELYGQKGGEKLEADVYIYDFTDKQATVQVVFKNGIAPYRMKLHLKHEEDNWFNDWYYSCLDKGNYEFLIDVSSDEKYEFYIEMQLEEYGTSYYSGIYEINVGSGSNNNETSEKNWYDAYQHSISENKMIITGYKGRSTELVIPEEAVIGGKKYVVEVDSLNPEEGAIEAIALTKISFGKGVVFGEKMSFQGMKALEELNVSDVDTSKMTSMKNMFMNCFSLKKLDLKSFDTQNVMDMSGMFAACYDLTELNLASFDTENVTNMGGMFRGCESLEKLDLSTFNTEKVCGTEELQNNCLEPIGTINSSGYNNWGHLCSGYGAWYLYDEEHDFNGLVCMFADCKSLKELDLSSFNTSNVVQLYGIFMGCTKLEKVNLSSFDTKNVVEMSYMFYGCESLKKLDLSNFDTSSVCGKEYAMPGSAKASYLYYRFTGMKSMFSGCKELTELNVSSFDTAKVVGMNSMFSDCSNIQKLDLQNFNTTNARSVSGMFSGCSKLEYVDLSGFDLSNSVGYNSMYGRRMLQPDYGAMFNDTAIVTIKTPRNIPTSYSYDELSATWSDEEMQQTLQILLDNAIFVDQVTGKEYTYLPYGEDSAESHTLVRKGASQEVDKPFVDGPSPRLKEDENGEVHCYVNGVRDDNYTGLALLYEKGKGDSFVYVEKGNRNENYSGYVEYDGALFYVGGGTLAIQKSGLVQDPNHPDDWYYLAGGQAQTQYTGLAQYDGAWFYVENGKLNTKLADFVAYDGSMFFVGAGRIMKEVNGLAMDPDGTDWYYLAEGQAQIQYTGLAFYDGEWFYVVDGKLAVDYYGTVEYDGASFEVVAGMVQ